MTVVCLARDLMAASQFARQIMRNFLKSSASSSQCRATRNAPILDFLKAQLGKPYDKLAIVAFAVNRDWRSPDAWFCDKLVAAGLEQVEVVPKLAPTVNRLDVRGLYLVVSAIAPVNS